MNLDEQIDEILELHDVCAGANRELANQTIKQLFLDMIGEDDKWVRGSTQNPDNPMYHTRTAKNRNELRAELRAKIGELK